MSHWQWWILTKNSRKLFLCQYCNIIAKIVLPFESPLFFLSNIKWQKLMIVYLMSGNVESNNDNKHHNDNKKHKHQHRNKNKKKNYGKQTRLIVDCYKLPTIEKHNSFLLEKLNNNNKVEASQGRFKNRFKFKQFEKNCTIERQMDGVFTNESIVYRFDENGDISVLCQTNKDISDLSRNNLSCLRLKLKQELIHRVPF